MHYKEDWKSEYEKEVSHAAIARDIGNEGMARVCARRAASIIIGEYLNRRGYMNLSNSSLDRILIFISVPNLDEQYRMIANHFLEKVNPNHNLSDDVDLIQDVKFLAEHILEEKGRPCAS